MIFIQLLIIEIQILLNYKKNFEAKFIEIEHQILKLKKWREEYKWEIQFNKPMDQPHSFNHVC